MTDLLNIISGLQDSSNIPHIHTSLLVFLSAHEKQCHISIARPTEGFTDEEEQGNDTIATLHVRSVKISYHPVSNRYEFLRSLIRTSPNTS